MTVMLFAGWGLLSTLVSLRVITLIDWSAIARPRPDGCWEVEHCRMEWFVTAWLWALWLLPSVVYAIVGWRLQKAHADLSSLAVAAGLLSAGTLVFYAALKALGGY